MSLKSYNPYTRSLIAKYEQLNTEQIDVLLEQSSTAYKKWRLSSFKKRSKLLLKVAGLLEKNQQQFAKIITGEMGKPIKESVAEVLKCAWVCRYYAEHGEKYLREEIIPTDAHLSKVVFEPIGPVLGIMPWNFPFWQAFRFLAPTVMAGNTTLLKHASNVQGCATSIEQLFKDAGFPEGVVQNIQVASSGVAPIIEDDRIKAVTLTGSEYAGSQVAQLAGKCIKKTVLELGGSNAFIVLDDANVDVAVQEAVNARMMNCGQSCIASKRFILLPKIRDEFTQKFVAAVKKLMVGDPMNGKTDLGPLSSEAQALEVEKQVKNSLALGAKLLVGGERNGTFYLPTVLDKVTPGMPCFDEEVFGPVASIIKASSELKAIELSNKSNFGLGATIFTGNFKRAEKLIPFIEDGAVFVNSLVKSDPRLPFGGTKKSGYGRELSIHGIREFVNAKTVFYAKKGSQ